MKTIKTFAIGTMLLLAFACNKDKIGIKPTGVRNDPPPLYHGTERIAPTGVRNDPPKLNNDPNKVLEEHGVILNPPKLYHDTE